MESSLRWVRSWTESQYQHETWCCQPPVMFSTLYILVFCSQLLPFNRLLCRAVRPTTNFSELPNYEVFFYPTDFCFFVFCWRIKVVSLKSELLPNHTLWTTVKFSPNLLMVFWGMNHDTPTWTLFQPPHHQTTPWGQQWSSPPSAPAWRHHHRHSAEIT